MTRFLREPCLVLCSLFTLAKVSGRKSSLKHWHVTSFLSRIPYLNNLTVRLATPLSSRTFLPAMGLAEAKPDDLFPEFHDKYLFFSEEVQGVGIKNETGITQSDQG